MARIRSGFVLGGLAMALCGAKSSASLCETDEKTHFGDPANVITVGGSQAAPASAAAGGTCTAPPACTANASWKSYIYPNIINSAAASPPGGGCTSANCHDMPQKGLQLDADMSATENGGPEAVRTNLLAYQLNSDVRGPYVQPCHPELSMIVCNLNVSDDVKNNDPLFKQFAAMNFPCGDPMPKLMLPIDNAGDLLGQQLNHDEFDAIVGWIQCGAPDN